jgi:hypothetical protein
MSQTIRAVHLKLKRRRTRFSAFPYNPRGTSPLFETVR